MWSVRGDVIKAELVTWISTPPCNGLHIDIVCILIECKTTSCWNHWSVYSTSVTLNVYDVCMYTHVTRGLHYGFNGTGFIFNLSTTLYFIELSLLASYMIVHFCLAAGRERRRWECCRPTWPWSAQYSEQWIDSRHKAGNRSCRLFMRSEMRSATKSWKTPGEYRLSLRNSKF